jgi:CheY-like chemotaxis protein
MIEEARDAAQAASQQKSEFLANMSHEIRTPMNGVLGMLELLRRTPLTGEQNEFVDTAAQSAENLLGILNSILDFSKIEAGKLELDYVDFNLRDLVEEVCALLATPAFAKGLELNCFIESKIPAAVHGDPLRLRQVITNLISNAIKFTEQGEVCVEVACLSQDQQRALIKFSVRDTGIGIAPEIQAALFQPFKQADGATTRRFGGTGLGLSISKSLIAGMGGSDIHIESTPGGGSTFWFSLDMEKQRATETTEAPKNLAYRKLLIVDDNATNRSILLRFLEDWGAQVSVAEDALQALELLREADAKASYFDLAILDMNMPNMDGLMLGRAMEQDPAMSRTPRILLSSGGPVSAAERVSAGFRQCLTKPVRQSMLFDAAVSALDEAWIKPSESIQMNAKDLPKMPGRSVLVVEDNAINQRVAQKMLACFEIEVQLAYHGEEALAAMKRQAFDLVLMDCQMPVLDGYAATAAWREYELAAGLRRVPVVALTANALEGDRELCLKAGMDDHLSKPFMLDDLSHILTRWINPSAVGGPPEPSEPLWDAQATLAGLGGDEELLAEIKPLFIEEAPKQLARLNPEGATPTLEQIADAAHTLKGMALRFFATKLVALASHVEQKARASGAGPTEADIAELTAAVEKLVKALKHD